jgi:hypothetical protein
MKTTRKEIYRIYGKENVILLGYCEIQCIQNCLTKVGHTECVEGWAADILYYNYDFNQRKRMIKRFACELSKAINN